VAIAFRSLDGQELGEVPVAQLIRRLDAVELDGGAVDVDDLHGRLGPLQHVGMSAKPARQVAPGFPRGHLDDRLQRAPVLEPHRHGQVLQEVPEHRLALGQAAVGVEFLGDVGLDHDDPAPVRLRALRHHEGGTHADDRSVERTLADAVEND